MKKVATLAACVALALVLTACSDSQVGPSDKRFGLEDDAISAKVVMDKVTGVYWVIFKNGQGGLDAEPILLPDGTPERVDNADYDDVAADIKANEIRWTEGYDQGQIEHDRQYSGANSEP